ncbi:putative DNA breaking-rejoining enzyme, catalytic core [Thiomonas arsenitoxydans]|jgi:hypothetical protein|uniref:DNA breaking-rejoining enzyme, catalytic core n=1 Tax=Thiomonas arsenitoxydans (strain DSM 22701 / CIP 110005 / 3As) TaxID=426114 RepID=D6CP03_THIA3|nr:MULTISPECIES: hypothetical protein [Thiomonas]OZB76999.1 MAG: DNA breaking-rejoining enzyme, catalytic core [Thiomonas sp. 14-64-326]CAZ90281.1 putative DNA breaking-rejoining enzyme, catalytic core [Thiomonas arsenitoxydans]CQR28929.1 putative DNA breaking-rejoining enzyme, catalytic core [Thiomonas arsenitoxydans]CQR31471.1 putative DNA breaking-rejoining enzyme, catalytic core [Thiomonas arsenitoxydans]CQR40903.1 putative DNA breaking-rejoining enzyme, catalytic core [Thiomonas arsenitox
MHTPTAQQTVLDTLRQLSGDADAAGAALQWIEAPDTALALALVIEGTQLLLPTLRTVAADDATALGVVAPSAEVIAGLQAMQNVLNPPSSKSPPALKPLQRPAATRLQPFRGVMSSHPLYTLLGSWHWRNANAAHNPIILKAVAMVVLFAKARAQQLAAEQAGSSPIYDACTALRELVQSHPQILAERPLANDWIRIPTSSERESQVDAIRRIIEPVLRHHDLIKTAAQDDENDEDSGETYSPPPQKLRLDLGDALQIQSVTRLRTTTVEALKRSGLSLAEFDPQEEYVEWTETGEDDPLDLTPPVPKERSLAEQVLRTRALIARRERSMQLLAADWTRLTEAEVARLWQALCADSKSQDPATRETAALLGLALWTSHPLQTEDGGLCALKIFSCAQDAPQAAPRYPLLLLDRWVLRLPVRRPAGQPGYHGVDRSKARPCADAIDVPLPVVLRPVIDALPSVQRLSTPPYKTRIDAFVLEPLQQQATDWLQVHAQQTAGRLTLSAVGQWMFRRLVEQRRDHALASLATGRPHLLADTGLHYLHVPTGDLVRWIRQEQARAWRALQQADPSLGENGDAHSTSAIEPDASDIGVGAPIVPLDRTVQALAHSLDQALTHARSTPLADDALLILHNAFTQYVHALLRFSLGLRDVGQPLPHWNQIDGHHGVVLLSDKDDTAASATRLAPLCTTALEQLRVYAQHARATLTRLTPETLISPPPVLFYLRRFHGRLECIDHPTREMHTALEQVTGYTLPRNTSRHWLRSRLVQMGLSGELIEFFMGHWQRGAEPWGRYSALPARRVIESLRDPIEQLVREAGFHVVRGWA